MIGYFTIGGKIPIDTARKRQKAPESARKRQKVPESAQKYWNLAEALQDPTRLRDEWNIKMTHDETW